MDDFLTFFFAMPDEHPMLMMSVLVFLAATTLTFGVLASARVRSAVKRRAAGISGDADGMGSRALRYASIVAAQRLVEYATRYYNPAADGETRNLRSQLIQAGFLDPRAGAYYFLARIVIGLGAAAGAFIFLPMVLPSREGAFWLLLWVIGIAGYFAPKIYLDRRIKSRRQEHRAGFPDFMDLLVVCAEAGLSMEASLDRVGRELAVSYRSLSANVHMATLEIRAGRTLSEALEHLGDRLGLEEARSFATLLQQSSELGSSITEALRVYSDDMRHKRLSRAEEKAYSLPAKLSVPMMLCIFPVLFVVILLPVFVRLHLGNY